MKRMLRVLHKVFHFMKNSSLYNDLQRFKRSPHNRAILLYVPGSDAATPADDGGTNHTLHNRLIEDMQPCCKSALSLVDGFTVASPLRSVVKVNTEIFVVPHHLHFFYHDGSV
ncbi:hypothetical protein ATANTOWER_013120 [Ataeniobius toweri]|uniref:Uncharacterized protein n=1 Tax=Ataeniobius toweri TaxID=208326 RepID=A0ABU7C2S9_9TELE|nr:hypothetical protein [Ataeniobius toweri]